ncbi:S1 family peptidase [Catellatospora bangladeshensis]|uniref:Peptidase S1 domain-containing protein n=1 Tax=Catellatospora bangladeshensis TaxID=310355 RepID=A0A8J3JTU7_9ACTN|nr:trypsin-like serine protease [Catellatospora bangladeshensis]GIF83659.1 hypothetical protein Cba03nite_50080 [Catellatospora bangladeshensis]
MSNEDNPRWSKGRRVAGALTGLVLGGAAFLLPTGVASAAPDGLPPLPANAKDIALEHSRIPSGAQKATKPMPVAGTYGAAFSGRATVKTGDSRIIGGELANPADHPGVVAVRSYFVAWDEDGNAGWYYSTCTGTVLSSTKVLTAAHCNVDLPFGTTFVIAGVADAREGVDWSAGQVARVGSTWTDQRYNYKAQYDAWVAHTTPPPPLHDVSVLTLKDALNSKYTPVTLADQGAAAPADGTAATIVGYGTTDPDGDTPAGILYAAEVPVQQNSDCTATYGSIFNTTAMMCAGSPNSSTPENGVDTCHGDSGGPIFVDGKQIGVTSWGYDPCASTYGVYARVSSYSDDIKADVTRNGLVNLDWTGDGHSDFLVRCKTTGWACAASGRVVMVSGSGLGTDGFGGISGYDFGSFGGGWNIYTKLMRVTSWNNDKKPSIIARDANGGLWQYKIDEDATDSNNAPFYPRIKIGSGWNMFNDIMVTNNWMGDGMPNLMGRKPNGELWIYTSDGAGGWKNPSGTRIGTGWGMFNTILTPGSWQGDGFQTLLGRKPDGRLYMYNSNGSGGWQNPSGTQIGSGWQMFTTFMSPGDWNGDDMIDLMGVKADGTVRLYTTNGKAGWIDGAGKVIDTDWQIFDRVF